MPSKSRALHDIRDSILSAQQFTEGYDLDAFVSDRKTFAATTRMLEIISEASRHLDQSVLDRNPHIPWRSVRDVGNFIRHDYDNVAETFVWGVLVDRLPTLLTAIFAEIDRMEQGNCVGQLSALPRFSSTCKVSVHRTRAIPLGRIAPQGNPDLE